MKVSIIALFAAPALVLGALAPQSGPAAVAHHHQNIARGIKAHPASHYAKRGAAKARRCAAKTASLSSASVSSTSVLAQETTTTTTKKADPTTTTKKPDPTTTQHTTHRTTTTTEKPKPTDDNNGDNGNSGSGKTYTGDATFYSTGLNACGTYDKDTDMIAALAIGMFNDFPGANGNSNENPICNRKVNACYKGNCVVCRITDACAGCQGAALDFSPSAFKQLADPDLGRLHGMTWQFI